MKGSEKLEIRAFGDYGEKGCLIERRGNMKIGGYSINEQIIKKIADMQYDIDVLMEEKKNRDRINDIVNETLDEVGFEND